LTPKVPPEPQADVPQEEPMHFEEGNDSSGSDFDCGLDTPKPFNQDDLNDLIRDLGLSKTMTEIEKKAWDEFVWLVQHFLGNKKVLTILNTSNN
jgi:hypothetical protein